MFERPGQFRRRGDGIAAEAGDDVTPLQVRQTGGAAALDAVDEHALAIGGQFHCHPVIEAQLAQLRAQAGHGQRTQSGGVHRRWQHGDVELDRLARSQGAEARMGVDGDVMHALVELLGGDVITGLEGLAVDRHEQVAQAGAGLGQRTARVEAGNAETRRRQARLPRQRAGERLHLDAHPGLGQFRKRLAFLVAELRLEHAQALLAIVLELHDQGLPRGSDRGARGQVGKRGHWLAVDCRDHRPGRDFRTGDGGGATGADAGDQQARARFQVAAGAHRRGQFGCGNAEGRQRVLVAAFAGLRDCSELELALLAIALDAQGDA